MKHPAKFSNPIIDAILETLGDLPLVGDAILDPFAGVGKGVQALRDAGFEAFGVEIECEWARQCPWVFCADFFDWAKGAWPGVYAAAVTSPTYGNRMADHHNTRDASKRNTYRHTLGRELSPNNSGGMQWGDDYRHFHEGAWNELRRLVRRDGFFLLNISDHIRKGEVIPVTDWHVSTCERLGWRKIDEKPIATQRQRHGANGEKRVECEWLITFENA